MPYIKNILVIPDHDAIFGLKGLKQEEIIALIKKYSSFAVLHFCAQLLISIDSKPKDKLKEQAMLARTVLDEASFNRFVAFLKVHLEDIDQTSLFHRTPVMMLAKLNLDYNDREGMDITSSDSFIDIASAVLSLTDIWLETGRLDEDNTDDFFEGLRSLQAKQALQENHEPMLNLLARGEYMLDGVRRNKKLNFDFYFEKATGLSLDVYVILLRILASAWATGASIEDKNLGEIAVKDIDTYFSKTDFTTAQLDAFIKIIGFRYEDYATVNEQLYKNIGMPEDKNLQNLIIFRSRPILIFDRKVICMSPNFLALQLTEGAYNVVREQLKSEPVDKDLLPTVWGEVYENYITERLEATYPGKVFRSLKDKSNDEVLDCLVDLGKSLLLIEIKYVHISYRLRMTGSVDDLKAFMMRFSNHDKHQGKIKGLGQIKNFLAKVDSRTCIAPVSLEGKRLIPVIILGEPFPYDPLNRELFEKHLEETDCLIDRKNIYPVILSDSEEVEIVEAVREEKGITRVKHLLISYTRSLDSNTRPKPYGERSFSLKNQIYNQNIRVPNSKYHSASINKIYNPIMLVLRKQAEN